MNEQKRTGAEEPHVTSQQVLFTNEQALLETLKKVDVQMGRGNWRAFPREKLPVALQAAESWKQQLAGVERPWLCWCVDEEWCRLQQKLIKAVGWTPVVGTDGRIPSPPLEPGAVFIDFNAPFGFPIITIQFPLEFVHLFAPRLAFWHSDVLIPVPVLRTIAEAFASLPDGAVMAVAPKTSLYQRLRRLYRKKPLFYNRWFEVIGCTTAGASLHLWACGCGWWRQIQYHPNMAHSRLKKKVFWEHGVGIWLWQKYFGGQTYRVPVDVDPYHYSTNRAEYRRKRGKFLKGSTFVKRDELRESFNLADIVPTLGLEQMSEPL